MYAPGEEVLWTYGLETGEDNESLTEEQARQALSTYQNDPKIYFKVVKADLSASYFPAHWNYDTDNFLISLLTGKVFDADHLGENLGASAGFQFMVDWGARPEVVQIVRLETVGRPRDSKGRSRSRTRSRSGDRDAYTSVYYKRRASGPRVETRKQKEERIAREAEEWRVKEAREKAEIERERLRSFSAPPPREAKRQPTRTAPRTVSRYNLRPRKLPTKAVRAKSQEPKKQQKKKETKSRKRPRPVEKKQATRVQPARKSKRQSAVAFFPFVLGTNFLDLDYAQVYSRVSCEYSEEQCLISTLRYFKVSDARLQTLAVKFAGYGLYLPRRHFPEIATLCKVKMNVVMYHNDDTKGTRHFTVTPSDGDWDQEIKIGFYLGHCFPEVDTGYSRFYLRNLELTEQWILEGRLAEKDRCNVVRMARSGGPALGRDVPTLTTSAVLRELNKLGYFKEKATAYRLGKRPDLDFLNAESVEMEQEEWTRKDPEVSSDPEEEEEEAGEEEEEKKKKKKKKKGCIWFVADFESFIQGEHEACMAAFMELTTDPLHVSQVVIADGMEEDPVQEMLTEISRVVRRRELLRGRAFQRHVIYFHNLKYDRTLIEKNPAIQISKVCEKSGSIYGVTLSFNKMKFELRDSLKMIPVGIGKFASSFQLPAHVSKKGEFILYEYFTSENREKRVTVEDYVSGHVFNSDPEENKVKQEDFCTRLRDFLQTEGQSFLHQDSKSLFSPWALYRYYLKFDVLVLGMGLQVFRREFDVITESKLNILDSITISSFANRFMGVHGCFDGAFSLNGSTRQFQSKAIYGGRVFCNPRFEGCEVQGELDYFDACSLYPSAIKFICDQKGGFPTGPCKFLNGPRELRYSFLQEHTSEYTVEIKITKIGRKQHSVPFIAYRDEKTKTLSYLNELPAGQSSICVFVDRQTLEDYIEFHAIEFEVLRGIYWTGDKNPTWGQVIQGLYDERLKCKRAGHSVRSDNLKLIMNSAYGKTIMKPMQTEKFYMQVDPSDDSKWHNRLENYFQVIKKFRWVGRHQLEIEQYAMDKSSTLCKYGSMILAASKHLMNRVFDLMSQNEMNIYYTDTDSFVMDRRDQAQLSTQFQLRYGYELIGEQLGQMHSDFNFKWKGKSLDPKTVWSTHFFPMAKKLYLHRLQARLSDGTLVSGIQFKCKGCTEEGILYKSKEFGDGDEAMEELYRRLSRGEELSIPLNPPGKTKFVYSKDNRVSTPEQIFYRTIKSPAAQARVLMQI